MATVANYKHTPGQWRTERDRCHFDTLSTVMAGDRGRLIVQIGGKSTVAEQEANARLIAAAPELLAALVTIVDGDMTTDAAAMAAADAARAAIALATGAA